MSHDIAHGVYCSGLVLEDINMIYVCKINMSHDIALFRFTDAVQVTILHRRKKVNFHRS